MRGILCAGLLVLAGCTAEEQADIRRDIHDYNTPGPPAVEEPAPTTTEVVEEVTEEVAERANNPERLVAYLVGLAVTIVSGYVGRKWIKRKYAAAKEAPKA